MGKIMGAKTAILTMMLSMHCLAETAKTMKHSSQGLYGVKIDASAAQLTCRTMPFLAAAPESRGETIREKPQPHVEVIPVGARASSIHFLGMINHGWDFGTHHWVAHAETWSQRNDQLYIGKEIGSLIIAYKGGREDVIPLEIGATAWFYKQYVVGEQPLAFREPLVSSPQHREAFGKSLKLKESGERVVQKTLSHAHFFLSVKPRDKEILHVAIQDDPSVRGAPLVSAITLAGAKPAANLQPLDAPEMDESDLEPTVDSGAGRIWGDDVAELANHLYMHDANLEKGFEPLAFPVGLEAAKIRFLAEGRAKNVADLLSNVWIANMIDMDGKFEPDTGFFHESTKNIPDYGGYQGVGTWNHHGKYNHGAFPRCSDHYASLIMRCVENEQRLTSYVDFCDHYLYYFRDNHDPEKGPPNPEFEIDKYPSDAPPHWAFVLNNPLMAAVKIINEIAGPEETDGHGSVMVGRWFAWRHLGAPTDEWLLEPRANIYGKSRWDSTCDAAEFICWLLDYTGRDVVWCEGETTGWGVAGKLHPKNMSEATNMEEIRENYRKANMFEPYPSYVCLTGLRCSAQMADALGKIEKAKRWREYADRIEEGMVRELTDTWNGKTVWRRSPNSVYSSFQDSMVQAWVSIYLAGLDPNRFHPEMTQITRNTLERQLALPGGHAQPQAMGYGQGWLTKTALILDEMDDAGPLLVNIGKFSYDKNMDFVDAENGKDWRSFMYIVPEGVNHLPDGSWYKLGDLGNGANQGIAIHALELCAGIDDTKPEDFKIIPRVPSPLSGIEITGFPVLIPKDSSASGSSLTRARINYSYHLDPLSFELESDRPLPSLSIRLGPFTKAEADKHLEKLDVPKGARKRIGKSGHYKKNDAHWIWLEGLKNIERIRL